MARVRIDLPQTFDFSTELEVSIAHINYGNHLGNDSALTILHDARMRFIKSLGFENELSIAGYGLIQADAAVVYKQQAFWGDRLRVEMAVCDIARVGFDMVYRVTHATEGHEVLQGKTGLVFFDYESQKPAPVPAEFLGALHRPIQ